MFQWLNDDILNAFFREIMRPLGIRTPSDHVSGKLSFVIHIPETNQQSGLNTASLAVQSTSEPTSEQPTVNEVIETVEEDEPQGSQALTTQVNIVDTEETNTTQRSSQSLEENDGPQDTASMTVFNVNVESAQADGEPSVSIIFEDQASNLTTDQSTVTPELTISESRQSSSSQAVATQSRETEEQLTVMVTADQDQTTTLSIDQNTTDTATPELRSTLEGEINRQQVVPMTPLEAALRPEAEGQSNSTQQPNPLPEHWEMKLDQYGRVFYIDHLNHRTQWERPTPAVSGHMEETEQRRCLLRNRYQSIRRTLSGRRQSATVSALSSTPVDETDSGGDRRQTAVSALLSLGMAMRSGRQLPSHSLLPESVREIPAMQFLTRADFLPRISHHPDASITYQSKSGLRDMIAKIRQTPSTFPQYQHNKDLTEFLNLFADKTAELPAGWETKFDQRARRVFFVDHNSRSTTFIDPRLPGEEAIEEPALRSRIFTESAVVSGSPRLGRLTNTRHARRQHNAGFGTQGGQVMAEARTRARNRVEAQRQVLCCDNLSKVMN
jgi:hypothetical protein